MNPGDQELLEMLQGMPSGEEGFYRVAQNLPDIEEADFFEKVSDYGKTTLKGLVEGVGRFGRMMGPLPTYEPEQEIQERQTETLDELLPTKDEDFIQSSLRRGLRQFPTAAGFPGSQLNILPRSILAGFLGEGAKELGAPEIAQAAAEITAFLGPDFTKKLIQTGRNKELIKAGKKFGLTDEQISPLLEKNFKEKWLSRLTPKKGRTEKILGETKKGLGKAREKLADLPISKKPISSSARENLFESIAQVETKVPASIRGKIRKDFDDLVNAPITGESIINFWADLNHELGPKSKQLSLYKKPLQSALQDVSPALQKDFDKINQLFSKFYKLDKKLKPSLTDDLVNAAESLGILGGAATLNFPFVSSVLAEKGLRMSARELLLNPRLQQLTEKFKIALNQNKYSVAKKVYDEFEKQLKKEDDNLELPDINEKKLKELFKSTRQ